MYGRNKNDKLTRLTKYSIKSQYLSISNNITAVIKTVLRKMTTHLGRMTKPWNDLESSKLENIYHIALKQILSHLNVYLSKVTEFFFIKWHFYFFWRLEVKCILFRKKNQNIQHTTNLWCFVSQSLRYDFSK